MKSPALLTLVLGVWLGASGAIWLTASASFFGIDEALETNEELASRANFDPEDEEAKRKSTLFVYAGELNQVVFRHFNRAQLVLAAVALLAAVLCCPARGVILSLILAALCVLALTFYLAPQIGELGGQVDFLSRATASSEELVVFERFDLFHDLYKYVEVGKCLLLLLASILAFSAPRKTAKA